MATIGIEKCISVYPMQRWETLLERLSEMRSGKGNERKLRRIIMASAHELEIDVAGRILVPQLLRNHAGIGQEVSVNGTGDRLEIWDLSTWNEVWETGLKDLSETAEEVGWIL
jgi:MraZ protein